jgi:hypothetical protein
MTLPTTLRAILKARHYPECRITGLDWSAVVAVARENAAAAGMADRYDCGPTRNRPSSAGGSGRWGKAARITMRAKRRD